MSVFQVTTSISLNVTSENQVEAPHTEVPPSTPACFSVVLFAVVSKQGLYAAWTGLLPQPSWDYSYAPPRLLIGSDWFCCTTGTSFNSPASFLPP
jgi:hypothetical protein